MVAEDFNDMNIPKLFIRFFHSKPMKESNAHNFSYKKDIFILQKVF